MKLNAYAKVNLILNVLGTRPDGYHEVEMLMQAISLCDYVSVACESCVDVLSPNDFEYGEKDLAWRAALLMAQTFQPELISVRPARIGINQKIAKTPGVRGVRVSIEKHIPAAAGLAGGSADAAAVMIGLGRIWHVADQRPYAVTLPGDPTSNDALMGILLPLGAKLGSDVPFCIASQLGHPAAIARGTGTELEFVEPTDCAVTLYFSDITIPDKTRTVYTELKPADCRPLYDIRAFLAAENLSEKRSLMGNHLQAPAERILSKFTSKEDPVAGQATSEEPAIRTQDLRPSDAMLCGAGPTYFTIGEDGPYRTVC